MLFQNLINQLTSFNNSYIDFSNLFSVSKNRQKILSILSSHDTPIFICDSSIIQKRYKFLNRVLNNYWVSNHAIAYSLKSNYQLIKNLKNLGAWAEVVSDFELNLALKLKFPGNQIIYNGPYKPNDSLKLAINNQVVINLDNPEELDRLSLIAKKNQALIGLRINIYEDDNHFGLIINSAQLELAIEQIKRHPRLNLVSLQCHLGSNIHKPHVYSQATIKLAQLANHLLQKHQIKIKIIDLGGGFPSHGLRPFDQPSRQVKSIDQYIAPICQILKKELSYQPVPQLILEPGRYLIDDSVVYICKVISKKNGVNNQQVVISNGANTQLPLSYYQPLIVQAYSSKLNPITSPTQSTIVYGSTCKDDDCLYNGKLPELNVNDYMVFFSTGAYNLNLTPEFIFSKPNLLIL